MQAKGIMITKVITVSLGTQAQDIRHITGNILYIDCGYHSMG